MSRLPRLSLPAALAVAALAAPPLACGGDEAPGYFKSC